MATPQIKLLNTVKALNEQGVVELTASERDQIERETLDLIKNSKRKRAMKAPEGFEEIIEKLQGVDADEAFKVVTDFLADKGLLESHGKAEDKADEVSGEMEEVMEKAEKGDKGISEKEDKKEDLEGFEKEVPVELGMGKKDKGMDEAMESEDEEKEEHKGMPFGKEKSKGEDKPFGGKPMGDGPKGPMKDKKDEMKGDLVKDLSGDMGSLKDKVIAQAMELSSEEKKKRMLEMQEEEDGKKSEDMPSMGMEAKVKVVVTASRNLLVVQGQKPLFHAVVNDTIKKDPAKLARLANKVSGWLIHEGIAKTAKKCNAKLLSAGVDEGINFGGQELPEADKGIADEGQVDAAESHEGDVAPTSQEGASFDSQEKRSGVARYTKLSQEGTSVTDDATDEIVEERADREVEVTEGATDEIVEEREEKEENTQEDAKFDIKNLEAQYRQLYASRAKKAAEKAQESFMEKFSRCLSIASQRMLKNLVYNPYKSASADVLMSTNIQFSNGDRYAGMDEAAAVELTELVSSEGHGRFIEALLKYSIDLMAKEDGYLSDVESDLQNLAPVPVEVVASRKQASNQSLRDEVIEGSMAIQAKRAATSPHGNSGTGVVREALSGTRTGRRWSKF
jgi:hypothetical protein